MRVELADPRGRSIVFVWEVVKVEMVKKPEHERYLDRSVKDIADELGVDPLDAFLDLSLADDLEMQFVLAAPPSPTRTEAVTDDDAQSRDDGRQLRRRRAPAELLRCRLHHPAAHGVGARRPHARAGGRPDHVDPRATRPGSPTAVSSRPVRRPT